MSQFNIYRNSDTSAPILSGAVGTLINLLNQCLVSGYGSKTAAGWTLAYQTGNIAAYRQGAGSQFYMRVHDAAPGVGQGVEARFIGYETMTHVDSGSNPFPTAIQSANGLFISKSASATLASRPWLVVADARTAYIMCDQASDSGNCGVMFGDIFSYVPNDVYNCMIIGNNTENSAGSASNLGLMNGVGAAGTTILGHYIARGYLGNGTSIQVAKNTMLTWAATATLGVGNITYPNPSDGAYVVAPIWVTDPTTASNTSIRGMLRGLWSPCHPVAGQTDKDTFSGVNELAGRGFLICKNIKNASNLGIGLFETSNTVPTN